jgi:isopentenyl-diphosphate delta-isomerase
MKAETAYSETSTLLNTLKNEDINAPARKQDHIEMAFRSQISELQLDPRFYYEPMLSAHPLQDISSPFAFLGKTMQVPMWVSSMTGGTRMARIINYNLAKACGEFGMGMGLGSCRSLLYSDEYLDDFNVRPLMGSDVPLFANLGIAQIEILLAENKLYLAEELLHKLNADGLIIHVNPMQEWLQPEGDMLTQAPVETIRQFLESTNIKTIVKEVGQGMGPESLRALFALPLEAIDFAASGGTNFALLELLRSDKEKYETYEPLTRTGHGATEMVAFTNQLVRDMGKLRQCNQVIISGGVKSFADGHYLMSKLELPCVYGQASTFLKHAQGDYEELRRFIQYQIKGLQFARCFLKAR